MKYSCVLILLKSEFLDMSVKVLNFYSTDLVEIFADGCKETALKIYEKTIPVNPFLEVIDRVDKYKTFKWLIIGNNNDAYKIKKFLITLNIAPNDIFTFDLDYEMSPTWIANYNYIERNGADFFATGNESMRSGLNIKAIPTIKSEHIALSGVNLSDIHQDLQKSYFIAKNIFSQIRHNSRIKFVLIGLSTDFFCQDNVEDFFNLEYLLFLKMLPLKFSSMEAEDLNFNKTRYSFYHQFSRQAVTNWQDYPKPLSDNVIEKNVQVLKDYIDLCVTNNAKPIGVVFPIAPAARKTYDEKILTNFREIIHKLEESTPFVCVDMFDLNIGYDCFCDMTHMNFEGCERANALLSMKLYQNNCIPIENFCNMTYAYFGRLSYIVPKDEYNQLMAEIFKTGAKMIGHKEKIKVAFPISISDLWCGDDLYNFFANDERFETTVFFGQPKIPELEVNITKKEVLRGFERFKQHGLNVVLMDDPNTEVPTQDILFYLTPYTGVLPSAFSLENVRLKSLIIIIPYSMNLLIRESFEPAFFNRAIFRTAYKVFSTSNIEKKILQNYCATGLPNAVYCGYPKMDVFTNEANLKFDWKMTRPDAKKIIYAPHWNGSLHATFRWNHQPMYEFAKAHPEISWVIKPHPRLGFESVRRGIFQSVEAYEDYMKQWDDLPNARFYPGNYYQSIFATSDGMIQDSISFIGEYQYVNKPMIYLLSDNRAGAVFNDLGKGILNVSYCVDGKDWEKIAATMQKVFIEGDDCKAEERKKFFDENLNYFKQNGMSASEFIYKTICKDLGV